MIQRARGHSWVQVLFDDRSELRLRGFEHAARPSEHRHGRDEPPGPERVIVFVDRARVTTTHVLRRQGKAALDLNDEGWPAGVVSDSARDRDSGTGLSHSIIKRLRCAPRYQSSRFRDSGVCADTPRCERRYTRKILTALQAGARNRTSAC